MKNRFKDLADRWGPTIRTISEQVAREYAAKGGERGHGWEVVSADDIEQETYLQLVKDGRDLEAMDSPEGFIRTTARLYGAANQARRARREYLSQFDDFMEEDPSTSDPYYLPEDPDLTEDRVTGRVTLEAARDFVTRLVEEGLVSLSQRDALRLFYLKGRTLSEVADEMGVDVATAKSRLSKARRGIGPEAAQSLGFWRNHLYPEVKAVSLEGPPRLLQEHLGDLL